jgi:hypothetical protein
MLSRRAPAKAGEGEGHRHPFCYWAKVWLSPNQGKKYPLFLPNTFITEFWGLLLVVQILALTVKWSVPWTQKTKNTVTF